MKKRYVNTYVNPGEYWLGHVVQGGLVFITPPLQLLISSDDDNEMAAEALATAVAQGVAKAARYLNTCTCMAMHEYLRRSRSWSETAY